MKKIHISDLKVGDEVYCQMRLGLALTLQQRGDGSVYWQVPSEPQSLKSWNRTMSRFAGWVVLNQPDKKLISLQITRYNSRKIPINSKEFPLIADISYTAFKRVRKVSETKFARNENLTFPANLPDAEFKPYRELVEVKLT